MDTIARIVGTNIKALRKASHLTRHDLGEKVGVNQSTIQRWEAGISWPSSVNIESLAMVFNIHPSQLFFSKEAAQNLHEYGEKALLNQDFMKATGLSISELIRNYEKMRDHAGKMREETIKQQAQINDSLEMANWALKMFEEGKDYRDLSIKLYQSLQEDRDEIRKVRAMMEQWQAENKEEWEAIQRRKKKPNSDD